MTKEIEGPLLFALFFGTIAIISWQAAKGKPRRWGRGTYLALFMGLLVVDVPVLLLLYVTPKSSPQFGMLDLASYVGVTAFGAAWGCLFAAIVYGRLRGN
ncbi:MAG TPA: hypothetical protein VJY15_23900 [Candidatus Acidoferrum sp.]|nr:hypothetical protein [Candidatus Acidoferrum sp.]